MLAFGAEHANVCARLGIIHAVGPAWYSRAGGRIDRRITLDMTLSGREEGGPVLDAAGGLLGISTLGPRRQVLVIPTATVEGVVEPLLSRVVSSGGGSAWRFNRCCPEAAQVEAGQSRGV